MEDRTRMKETKKFMQFLFQVDLELKTDMSMMYMVLFLLVGFSKIASYLIIEYLNVTKHSFGYHYSVLIGHPYRTPL